MTERRRVAITGIGAVTPIGTGREGLWAGLRAEQSAVRTITRFDPEMWRSRNAAQVNDFSAGDYVEGKKAKRLDRFGGFSVACAMQAVADAGIDLASEDRERVGAMRAAARQFERIASGGIVYQPCAQR